MDKTWFRNRLVWSRRETRPNGGLRRPNSSILSVTDIPGMCTPSHDGVCWATPLLVMSANRESLQQAVEFGGCQVLEKPFDLAAVLALIDRCLACHR